MKNAEQPFMRTWRILTSTNRVDVDMGEFVAVVKIYCNRPSVVGSNAAMAASCVLKNTILPRLVDTFSTYILNSVIIYKEMSVCELQV